MKNLFKLLTLAIIALIFYFSSQPVTISLKQSNFIADFFNFNLPFIDIRKLAHFVIYLSLGFCFCLAFEVKTKKQFFLTMLFIFIFACSDELHQSFSPGRGPRFSDVLIDTLGSFFGINMAIIARRLYKFLLCSDTL
ncbi:VanZ family protein [Cetobacterium sp. 2A]|uniref:VanZ family protein n=1 Tax=Cetobacterium sp. 2A TaxID=2754723 RepID=UPI00163D0E9B|nr:VanZ family protein [Cetobacterium sp. 2A]MBC2856185.1 VanZ family protein [Cetobacterium sp. 2A]